MSRAVHLSVFLVCALASAVFAKPENAKPLARPADPLLWELPALVGGKTETRTIRSFFTPQTKNIVFILETGACEMCDRAAPSNRALGKSVRQSDGILIHVLHGAPGDLKALLERRVYDNPVVFDLDGAFTRTLGANPAEAPLYIVVDDKENVVSMMSGLKTNPATIQLSILAALMIKKTQTLVDKSPAQTASPAGAPSGGKSQKPATP